MSRTITYGITTLHIRVSRVFTRNATLPGVKPYPPPQVLDEESLKIMRMIETQPVGMRYD